jgi:hypothetical protein
MAIFHQLQGKMPFFGAVSRRKRGSTGVDGIPDKAVIPAVIEPYTNVCNFL